MGDSENGIRQSPFADVWGTPDVGGNGASGIGGGLDMGSGPNGIVCSPYDKPACPTPSGAATADGLESGKSSSTFPLDGSGAGQAPWDVTSSRNTVDKR